MSVYYTNENCIKTIQCGELRKGEICFGELKITEPVPQTFDVVCVEYKRPEKFFTIGKIYKWENGTLTTDDGFTYDTMVSGADPDKWELSNYYKFIKVVR